KNPIASTAAISGGVVFVGTEDTGLLALDLHAKEKTGKELWRAATGATVEASPAVEGGRVYFGDKRGVFRALDAKSGKQIWMFEAGQEPDGGGTEISSSAVLHGGKILFGSYDACLYCLSAADGKILWRVETQGPVHASPAVAGDRTFVAGCDEQLRFIDIESGKEVSVLPMGAYSAGSPAVAGDRLVLGTFGAQVLCIDLKTAKVLWTFEDPDRKFPFYASPAVGPLRARAAAGAGASAKPELVAVVAGRDKTARAFRIEDGKLLWTFTTKARIDASPVIVGARVIVAGMDGNLYLLDLETGKEVWKFTAGPAFLASPAVGEGRLVISTEEGLVHCFDLKP
ncbi:MAG TPA: PQQ-binding-like beta-propeller repeat protein, partial [Planctomycetota bacterium]|nr:PQQ-binding-like beta-propeller repeat protein [Planctomycetota bacterium]